jgi:hypothetical protein
MFGEPLLSMLHLVIQGIMVLFSGHPETLHLTFGTDPSEPLCVKLMLCPKSILLADLDSWEGLSALMY